MKRFAFAGPAFLCTISLLLGAGCDREAPPTVSTPVAEAAPIVGTITLADGVEATPSDVLYIIVRGDQGGPPAAVKRIDGPRFPLAYSIGPADSMVPGVPFEGPFQLKARLSRSGDAMPHPGDIEGFFPEPVRPGGKQADVHLAQVIQ